MLQHVAVEDPTTPFLGLFFRGGSLISFGRSVREDSEQNIDLGTWKTLSIPHTVHFPLVTALFLVSI